MKCTLALLFALCLSLCSCGGGTAGVNDGLTGRVTLDGYEGRQVYLETTTVHPQRVDSAWVKDGKFTMSFSDSIPQVYRLVLGKASDDLFPIILPVVSEKGQIKVSMGEYVLTSGTPLNDRLQDFLIAVSNLTDKAMKQEEPDMIQVKADLSKLVEGSVMQNIKTPVGAYIYRMYSNQLDDTQKALILERADEGFKELVE